MLVVILLVHQLKLLSYKCVQKKGMLISDSLGQTKKKMWWWWRRNDYRNAVLVLFGGKMIENALVVVVVLEERKLNCRVG